MILMPTLKPMLTMAMDETQPMKTTIRAVQVQVMAVVPQLI
jgi:hypothetical protein